MTTSLSATVIPPEGTRLRAVMKYQIERHTTGKGVSHVPGITNKNNALLRLFAALLDRGQERVRHSSESIIFHCVLNSDV